MTEIRGEDDLSWWINNIPLRDERAVPFPNADTVECAWLESLASWSESAPSTLAPPAPSVAASHYPQYPRDHHGERCDQWCGDGSSGYEYGHLRQQLVPFTQLAHGAHDGSALDAAEIEPLSSNSSSVSSSSLQSSAATASGSDTDNANSADNTTICVTLSGGRLDDCHGISQDRTFNLKPDMKGHDIIGKKGRKLERERALIESSRRAAAKARKVTTTTMMTATMTMAMPMTTHRRGASACLSANSADDTAENDGIVEVEDEHGANNDGDDDEDVPCDVCGDRADTARNPILLCDSDGCSAGARHLLCCTPRLLRVPKGDWHCCRCEASAGEPAAPGDLPLGVERPITTEATTGAESGDDGWKHAKRVSRVSRHMRVPRGTEAKSKGP